MTFHIIAIAIHFFVGIAHDWPFEMIGINCTAILLHGFTRVYVADKKYRKAVADVQWLRRQKEHPAFAIFKDRDA